MVKGATYTPPGAICAQYRLKDGFLLLGSVVGLEVGYGVFI
jgi:hypothetical protein